MFGSKNNDPAKNQVSLTQSALNSLVSGTSVEGTISADNDIRIDGYLKGILNCKGKVIIGPKGNIDGEIKAQNAVIEGQFRGSLFIEDLLHIKETAQVEGEINTDKLSVAPGARFNVLSKMSTSSSGPAPLPKKEQ
ncbi:MAG: polymer-forming cytoskeletal protein [Saprospiraceae bacterium]|jgi:cytoskeletal protein CcmA (bactofilin family)|nr:polymer-forming cytoskeletal protein [Saprospiraceae bacterium]MBK7796909.1 polymer-forming cytoskeletal protein [Saprospiraceae bacterium]MBK8152304.1 polymer-forming cytoskeletal protein [Saprospiraceae bacterium]MBL0259699.1 polymer-forming cytoskeletal protein [Saprospiraceae bacterium]MBX7164036.1 polymer-forming cytoskeletal protein [Saprospiraceae bacterium]